MCRIFSLSFFLKKKKKKSLTEFFSQYSQDNSFIFCKNQVSQIILFHKAIILLFYFIFHYFIS